jgi:hypothetical protein
MKRLFSLIVILLCLFSFASANSHQKKDSASHSYIPSDYIKIYQIVNPVTHEIIRKDTATIWYFNNILTMPQMTDSLAAVTDYDAKYYKLFVPMTYYYAPGGQYAKLNWQMTDFNEKEYIDRNMLPYDTIAFNDYHAANSQVNDMLFNLYMKDYRLVHKTEDFIMSRKTFDYEVATVPQPKTKFANLFKSDMQEDNIEKGKLMSYRPNWWTYAGSISLQMTQNYISSNWYKGGESTNTMLGYFALKANYNDKEKIQWDNLFEAKYGITSAPSDTCHNFLVSNDLLRVYSKLGIQASKKWYYTLAAEFNTQFSNSYKKNTNTVLTSFLAPANLILTLGMDYKLKNKKIDFSLLLSPAAYQLRYVGDKRVDETTYGLTEGKKFLHIVGSKLTSTWTWQVLSSLTWTSRLYYFTDYKGVEAEWENTFNFKLNKYLSAQLFIHERFDDTVTPTEGSSYFQTKEYMSFGINYAW